MADLIELDEYKEYKSINNPNNDGKIVSFIAKISTLIQTYCNRQFLDYSSSPDYKTEWFDGKVNAVDLREFPVIQVISVNTSADGGVTQTVLIESSSGKDGYFVDLPMGRVMTQQTTDKFITSYDTPYRSLEIEYLAGYTVDTLPEDLKLAVLDLVDYYMDEQRHPTKSLMGATIDNPFPSTGGSFPAHVRRVLDLYRYSP